MEHALSLWNITSKYSLHIAFMKRDEYYD
jgi:hypothetical protein